MITGLIIGGMVLLFAKKRKQRISCVHSIGKLSDSPLSLSNILMGVDRGWYRAKTDILSTGYVVYLSGKKANGEYTEDVYPISKETYQALQARGI